jgi:uracil-DNA glycosylase
LKKNEKFYFPIYHPAAGLRFPKIREILEKDFEKLKIPHLMSFRFFAYVVN